MTKKPKRKNLRGPGKCVFCGGGAVPGNKMTDEHLWSDWMENDGLLKRLTEDYIEANRTFRRTTNEDTRFQRYRQGSPHYKKLKFVCQQCNSGWMSLIEDATKPILTLLIKGERVLLTLDMQRRLVEWIVLKILVAEHNRYAGFASDPIYTQPDRTAFMLHRTIPFGLRIAIGRQNGFLWKTAYHRHASGLGYNKPLLPPPKDPVSPKNVQTITWGIGQLLVHLSGVTSPDIYEDFVLKSVWPLRSLWPLADHDIIWPPLESVDDDFADSTATALERFLNANAT